MSKVLINRQTFNTESTIDSEGFKGGTRGSPIMPRDAVSRTANVERTGRHKWVNPNGTWLGYPKKVANIWFWFAAHLFLY